MTDVNIALTMYKLAVDNKFDKALLFSADSDLLPAFRAVKEINPSIKIFTVIPISYTGKALSKEAYFELEMKKSHLDKALLPSVVSLKNGQKIRCPSEWL